ncbi:RNA polymerase sigma factor [Micromonospora sp. NPDC049366]|uniref:RNA polymerase sigma factor n=1 Tax=Micromonospora sp. NPDC049366 TaxID=3364271 RepID=UPI00378D6C74
MPSLRRARFTRPRSAVCAGADPDARPDLWDLVDQARDGKIAAFGDLYDQTFDTVFRFVMRRVLGDRGAAEEITADVYVAALRTLHGVRRTATSPVAWLITIAARRTIDYHRKSENRKTVPGGDGADLVEYRPTSTIGGGRLTDRPAESVCVDRDEARAFWDHVRQVLPAEQDQVIRYRFGLGLSVSDTAAEMGKPTAAVKMLQLRAIANLRDRLAGTVLDPASAPAVLNTMGEGQG